MIQIDSDVLIRYLRGHAATVEHLRRLQETETLACSVITTFEVLRGATANQRPHTEALIGALVQLPVTEAIARDAAEEFRHQRAQNVTLAQADLLIGCTARAHGLPLMTGNARHYPLAGLVVLPAIPPGPAREQP